MILFPPPVEIGLTEGFTPEKDIFGRAAIGLGLLGLIKNASDPLVVAIDGQWGSGKTAFLKMWAGALRSEGFPVISFDAFEHDYIEDAFTAVAGEIIALIQERKKLTTPAGKRFAAKSLEVAKVVGRAGLRIGIKAASLGALEGTEFSDLSDDIADAATDLSDEYLSNLLTKRIEHRQSIEAFRNALSELPPLLSEGENNNGQLPLVFIVDELDRCRPSFALALLERMKHFFSVRNVHFVLGVNVGQLHSSIALTYGAGIDAKTYLQKFIHLFCYLNNRADNDGEPEIAKFLRYLLRSMQFSQTREVVTMFELLEVVAVRGNLSFRTIERVVTTIAIALSSTQKVLAPILAGLAIMKVVHPVEYQRAKRGILTLEEITGHIVFKDQDDCAMQWIYRWWDFALNGTDNDEKFAQALWNYNVGREQIVPYIANNVLGRFAIAKR